MATLGGSIGCPSGPQLGEAELAECAQLLVSQWKPNWIVDWNVCPVEKRAVLTVVLTVVRNLAGNLAENLEKAQNSPRIAALVAASAPAANSPEQRRQEKSPKWAGRSQEDATRRQRWARGPSHVQTHPTHVLSAPSHSRGWDWPPGRPECSV